MRITQSVTITVSSNLAEREMYSIQHYVLNFVTFNTIFVISWRSVLLVDEIGVPEEHHRSAASHWQTLSHSVVSIWFEVSRIRTHLLHM